MHSRYVDKINFETPFWFFLKRIIINYFLHQINTHTTHFCWSAWFVIWMSPSNDQINPEIFYVLPIVMLLNFNAHLTFFLYPFWHKKKYFFAQLSIFYFTIFWYFFLILFFLFRDQKKFPLKIIFLLTKINLLFEILRDTSDQFDFSSLYDALQCASLEVVYAREEKKEEKKILSSFFLYICERMKVFGLSFTHTHFYI